MLSSIAFSPAQSFMISNGKVGLSGFTRPSHVVLRPQFSLQPLPTTRRRTTALGLSMMFDQLSGQLSGAMRRLSGQATITDKNIESALKEVKRSLLEADVNIDVAAGLVSDIRKRAVGMDVVEGVTPAQQFIKIMSVRVRFQSLCSPFLIGPIESTRIPSYNSLPHNVHPFI
jgi:hypothetical protein